MQIVLYAPDKMYGFAEGEGHKVFFHVECFVFGRWSTLDQPPPPILGEEVVVEHEGVGDTGKAPRASLVTRVNHPLLLRGEVDTFNAEKGWGFAKGCDGDSYFLHRSEVVDNKIPLPGQPVTFYRGFKNGRPRACYVRCDG